MQAWLWWTVAITALAAAGYVVFKQRQSSSDSTSARGTGAPSGGGGGRSNATAAGSRASASGASQRQSTSGSGGLPPASLWPAESLTAPPGDSNSRARSAAPTGSSPSGGRNSSAQTFGDENRSSKPRASDAQKVQLCTFAMMWGCASWGCNLT